MSVGLTGSDMEMHTTPPSQTIPTITIIHSHADVVEEARSWIGTPYHKNACVKHAGVDCGTILFDVMCFAGFISEEEKRIFKELVPKNQDWFCHSAEEKYTKLVLRHAHLVLEGISYKTLDAKPGNIVVTKHCETSKHWNHGGIVTQWPMLVHAVHPFVKEVNATNDPMWCYRKVEVFDPWAKWEAEH